MPNNNWESQRAEIAAWLSGWAGMIKKWVDKILDSDHDVDKNKIINTLTEWIKYLEDTKLKIIKMNSTPPKEEPEGYVSKETNEDKQNLTE